MLTILPRPDDAPLPTRHAAAERVAAPPHTDTWVPAKTSAANVMPSIEAVILQKLLAELETRQAGARPQVYDVADVSPTRKITTVHALWSSLWALSLVLCIVVVKYFDSRTMGSAADSAQAQSIRNLTATIGDQKQEFAKMFASMQTLTAVITTASVRTATIPAMLQRLGRDLKYAAPVAATVATTEESKSEAALPVILTPSQPLTSAVVSLGGHHHPPMENAVAPADVTVHHNLLGVMDYWLVPRVNSGVRTMVKVVPIAQSENGILVHDVLEIKDYIVTTTGDWLTASAPNQIQ